MPTRLALEGQRKNILVNTIAPVAASRLTEGLLPPAVFDALKPEYVSPLVAYLCSEESDTTGALYEVGGGLYTSLRWERTKGKVFRLGREVTPEALQASWEQINDFSETEVVHSIMESLGPVIENVEAGPSKGGNELIDVDAALGAKYPDRVSSYDENDLALYALGVGAATDPREPQELRLVYEGSSEGMKALPTYAVIPGTNAVLGFRQGGHHGAGSELRPRPAASWRAVRRAGSAAAFEGDADDQGRREGHLGQREGCAGRHFVRLV